MELIENVSMMLIFIHTWNSIWLCIVALSAIVETLFYSRTLWTTILIAFKFTWNFIYLNKKCVSFFSGISCIHLTSICVIYFYFCSSFGVIFWWYHISLFRLELVTQLTYKQRMNASDLAVVVFLMDGISLTPFLVLPLLLSIVLWYFFFFGNINTKSDQDWNGW